MTANVSLLSRLRRSTTLFPEGTLSETAVRRVHDNAPVGLIEVDRVGRILWSNPRARTLLGLADGAPVYRDGRNDKGTVVSIRDNCATESYVGILRKLARGEPVNDVHCSLCRPDGRTLKVAVDAASQLSGKGRVVRIVYALHETNGRGDVGSNMEELSGDLSTAWRGMDRKRAPETVITAHELQQGVGQPLIAAWLELDACRAACGNTDHPAMLGRLELMASFLREAVFNLHLTTAKCPSTALDNTVVGRTRWEDCRSGSDNRRLHPSSMISAAGALAGALTVRRAPFAAACSSDCLVTRRLSQAQPESGSPGARSPLRPQHECRRPPGDGLVPSGTNPR